MDNKRITEIEEALRHSDEEIANAKILLEHLGYGGKGAPKKQLKAAAEFKKREIVKSRMRKIIEKLTGVVKR